MFSRRHAAVLAGALLVLSVTGTGAALAAGGQPGGAGAGMGLHPGPGPHRGAGAGLRAVASYLGLTTAELRAQLQSGKSLAQVATAQGKTVDGLKAAILDAAKTRLDQAVAAGRLTSDQAKARLALLTARLDTLVNRTGLGACAALRP